MPHEDHTDARPNISVTEYIQLLNKLDGIVASIDNMSRRLQIVEEAKRVELAASKSTASGANELRKTLEDKLSSIVDTVNDISQKIGSDLTFRSEDYFLS